MKKGAYLEVLIIANIGAEQCLMLKVEGGQFYLFDFIVLQVEQSNQHGDRLEWSWLEEYLPRLFEEGDDEMIVIWVIDSQRPDTFDVS